jgi:heme-degrading monooxygenase HmoA
MTERQSRNDHRDGRARILRTWCGSTTTEDAEAYVGYMKRTGYEGLRTTPGNRGVLGLLRVVDGHAEHIVMSLWDSEEAIARFAGDDIARAVFYPEDDRFLVDKDEHVRHFQVVFADGWDGI